MIFSSKPPALPPASAEEQAISHRLTERIRGEINERGPIPFARFMELALYAPGLGYYSAGRQKFGAAGDFITAPESFPLFAKCLANTAAEALSQIEDGDILEVGAGSGRLAMGLLKELEQIGILPKRYYILELSAELRARQAETIQQQAPALLNKVHWLDQLPPTGFRGLVLGNELLDAMPVTRFRVTKEGIRERCVDWKHDQFVWCDGDVVPAIEPRLASLALETNYESEVGFTAEAWVRSIAERLAAGVVLLIDYGFPRAEFYHPERSSGTLMCHYHHHAHSDPLTLVGLQDITAHVDFTAIAEAGTDAGLDLLGYTSQGAFLLGSGLEQLAARSDPNDVRAHLTLMQQIKTLTLPHEMGELFKVVAFGRGLTKSLKAFALQDRRGRL